jgi:hypothetical protein
VVSRSGCPSSSAALAPLMHRPPRFTGKPSRPVSSSVPSGRGVSVIPHCREQYGQCVSVGAPTHPSVGDYDYAAVVPSLRSALSRAAPGVRFPGTGGARRPWRGTMHANGLSHRSERPLHPPPNRPERQP